MRIRLPSLLTIVLVAAGAGLSPAAISAPAVRPGMPAPDFSAADIAGRTIRLDDYAGKIVVLEWTNDGCPFVGKHYDTATCRPCSANTPPRV